MNYKQAFLDHLVAQGWPIGQAKAHRDIVYHYASKYRSGARDIKTKQYKAELNRFTNSINSPINNPINNPKKAYNSFGKQILDRTYIRTDICEICGRKAGERQFANHHVAHECHIADLATLELCPRCHHAVEGKGMEWLLDYWAYRELMKSLGAQNDK